MKRKRLSMLLVVILCLGLSIGAAAASDANLYDQADLLTHAEETQLTEKLSAIGEGFDAQIVVMTVSSTEGSIDAYVEAVYDSMRMGYGENRDGVLLLVCMDTREYRILSNGYAGEAIGPNQIEAIGESIVPMLSEGAYADACIAFADECSYYLNGYWNGFAFPLGKSLIVSLVIGAVAGIAVALVLKKQLKSVRQQKQAKIHLGSPQA